MKKVAIFVDVQNVYYTVKESFGCHFDYAAFWQEVTEGREVVHAFAYAIDRGDPKQIRFQEILKSIGFEVKLKPFIQRRDGSAKGDWDVGITLDMIESAQEIDVAVLASGDCDFDLVVSKLREAHSVEEAHCGQFDQGSNKVCPDRRTTVAVEVVHRSVVRPPLAKRNSSILINIFVGVGRHHSGTHVPGSPAEGERGTSVS